MTKALKTALERQAEKGRFALTGLNRLQAKRSVNPETVRGAGLSPKRFAVAPKVKR